MKTKIFLGMALLLAAMLIYLVFLNNDAEHRRRMARVDKVLKGNDNKLIFPGGKVVSKSMAEECIAAYDEIFKEAEQKEIMKYAFTEDVSFGVHGLMRWMVDMADSTDMNSIRVFYGMYTRRMAAAYPEHNLEPGRVTVFLWPYNKDKKAVYKNRLQGGDSDTTNAYNLGTLEP